VFYNARNGLNLQLLPVMAAVTPGDDEQAFRAKSQLIASYLDLMITRRMVNYRNFGYSTIVNTMFNLAEDLRDRDAEEVRAVLADRVAGLEETFRRSHVVRTDSAEPLADCLPASVLRRRFVLIAVRGIRGSRRRSWSR